MVYRVFQNWSEWILIDIGVTKSKFELLAKFHVLDDKCQANFIVFQGMTKGFQATGVPNSVSIKATHAGQKIGLFEAILGLFKAIFGLSCVFLCS